MRVRSYGLQGTITENPVLTTGASRICCVVALLVAGLSTAMGRADEDSRPSIPSDPEWSELSAAPLAPLAGSFVRAPGVNSGTLPDDGTPRGPGSDSCAGATVAVDGLNFFSTIGATPDGPSHTAAECQFAGTLNNNVWFTYTASCNGLLTISTCEDLGASASFDTRIAIYSGTCASLTLEACNDDDTVNACGLDPNFHSTALASVTSGANYLISIGGFNAAETGTGNLLISCVPGAELGACCLAGVCTDGETEAQCESNGGLFAGFGSTCQNTICPCGGIVWSKGNPANVVAIAGAAPGNPTIELGNVIQLGGATGLRDICRISVIVQEGIAGYEGVDGTPFDLSCTIWDLCPGPAVNNTIAPCGAASGATMLGAATTAGVVVPTGFAISVNIDFNPPIASAPDTIAVMFRASRAGPGIQLGGNPPEIGALPVNQAIRCGSASANNGCVRTFGVNNAFAFSVEAQLSAEYGSCGDLDHDNDVDADDFSRFLIAMGHSTGDAEFHPGADVDDDGVVTLVDYQLWLACYRLFIGDPHISAPIPSDAGDMNADGNIDGMDIQAFVSTLLSPEAPGFRQQFVSDINGDGALDSADAQALTTRLLP